LEAFLPGLEMFVKMKHDMTNIIEFIQ